MVPHILREGHIQESRNDHGRRHQPSIILLLLATTLRVPGHVTRLRELYTLTRLTTTLGAGAMISPTLQIRKQRTCSHMHTLCLVH